MKRVIAVVLTYVTIGAAAIFGALNNDNGLPETIIVKAEPFERTTIEEPVETVETPVQVYNTVKTEMKSRMVEVESIEKEIVVENDILEVAELPLSDEEIDLLALLTMAEAEGESELGKRLVIDTVLNRVDSELRYFPDTVTDVIYQKNAFTSMWNDRVDRCYVMDDIRQLVIEELESRTNSEVMYFRTSKYSKYGTPLFQEGNHYFSGN